MQMQTSFAQTVLATGIANAMRIDPVRVIIEGIYFDTLKESYSFRPAGQTGRRLQDNTSSLATVAQVTYLIKTWPGGETSNAVVAAAVNMTSALNQAFQDANVDVKVLGIVVNQPVDMNVFDPCAPAAASSLFLRKGLGQYEANRIAPTFMGLAVLCVAAVGLIVHKCYSSQRRLVSHGYARVPEQDPIDASSSALLSGSESALE